MKKILVVDDEGVSLMMTENILSGRYAVVGATSGAEALDKFDREAPDMVLSDLRMPGMSGYELQRELNSRAGRTVPFMLMTADTDDETESRGFENGALDFIRKPFRADVLLQRVGNILRAVDMKKAASTDPMTGLLNKASARTAIGKMCASGQGVLMVVDLDSFKPVNDIYGHAAGDRVLIRFAEILLASVRSSDAVGRMGGDEFIVFCRDVLDEAVVAKKSRFINRCVAEAAKEFLGEGCAIPLGASIGCAVAPRDGTDFARLAEKADKALYEVKRNGKHGFRFWREEGEGEAASGPVGDPISRAVQLLKERAQEAGAFPLPFEEFRTVYRFLVRLNANYGTRVWLVAMSLADSAGAAPSSEVSSRFLDVLRGELRQSDVVAESARGQFMALILHAEFDDVSAILARVEGAWSAAGGAEAVESEVAPLV